MKTAEQVRVSIEQWKAEGIPLSEVAWKTALACVGWAYVFGARGIYCDPVNRRNSYSSHGAEHPTIKSACKNFEGSDQIVGACATCKWYPGGRTRVFDCRGFTYWVLKQVYGWELMGAGATSQWSNGSNWKAKGEIATMPKDTLCCLFVAKGKTMEHTGFGYNSETVECSSGVQHFTTRKAKWTHWAIPACISLDDAPITPTAPADEAPATTKPTLKRGSKGQAVKDLQTKLVSLGYNIGSYGIDGDFGKATEAAVKQFQRDHNLTADGIVGPKTYAALEGGKQATYTVTIEHLAKARAEEIIGKYGGKMTAE